MGEGLKPPGSRELQVASAVGTWRLLTGEHETEGSRLPALLLHGGGYDAAGISWFRLIEPLSAERAVIAPDLPGFGGTSDVPALGRPDLTAGQLQALLDALGVGRVVVFGVSMGGDVALELALRHPDRVAGLVCIAPGGLIPRRPTASLQWLTWLVSRVGDRGLAAIAWASRPLVRRAVKQMVDDPRRMPSAVVEEFVRQAYRPRAGVAYGIYNRATLGPRGMLNDKSGAVASLRIPALFFHGHEDRLVPVEASRRAVSRMPQARLVELENCGHLPQLEQHEQFLKELETFLSQVDGRDAAS